MDKFKIFAMELQKIIMGNMAGDVDSVVSSIALAQKYKGIPLLNIPFDDLNLRQDVVEILKYIQPEKLLFNEAVPGLMQKGHAWILVDHNQLAPDQEVLAPYVVEIFDHHVDEQVIYPHLKKKIVRKVGSTATLIAQELEEIDSSMAFALLVAILLDTENLQNAYKVTDEDRWVVQKLQSLAGPLISSSTYNHFLAKRNLVDVSQPELYLRKDFKSYREGSSRYGISSLRMYLEPNTASLDKFMQEKEIELLLLFSSSHALFYSKDEKLKDNLRKHLKNLEGFELEKVEGDLLCYRLKSVLSRKVLQPLLKPIFL